MEDQVFVPELLPGDCARRISNSFLYFCLITCI